MNPNEIVRAQMLKIVDNQIKGNKPPETKQTYKRLISEGFSDLDSKKLIAQCVAVLLFDAMKNNSPVDHDKYLENLRNLPKEPI